MNKTKNLYRDSFRLIFVTYLKLHQQRTNIIIKIKYEQYITFFQTKKSFNIAYCIEGAHAHSHKIKYSSIQIIIIFFLWLFFECMVAGEDVQQGVSKVIYFCVSMSRHLFCWMRWLLWLLLTKYDRYAG